MPGKGVPKLRYTGANSGWMTLDLVFDTTRDRPPATVRVAIVVTLKHGPAHRVRIWRDVRLP